MVKIKLYPLMGFDGDNLPHNNILAIHGLWHKIFFFFFFFFFGGGGGGGVYKKWAIQRATLVIRKLTK